MPKLFLFWQLLVAFLLSALPVRAQVMMDQAAAVSPSEIAATPHVRYFREVQDPHFPGAYQALARLSRNGEFILAVETNAERAPISDTLLVWIQHHSPEEPLAKQADWADLIISCYPELLTSSARERHVLPEAREKVWLYFAKDRHLIISDQRQPLLDFALKSGF